MRTLRFDSGETWDNPNARWADPSYVLEPGDPGYVPPASPANQPPTKRSKRVKHNNYYPIRIGDQVIWLENYRLKLPGYATVLSLSAGQVTGAVADAGWVIYLLQSWLSAVRAYSLAATDVVTEALNGDGTKLMELPVFTAPALQ